jgi:hypothetical protein
MDWYYRNPKVKASDVISVALGVSFSAQLPGEKWVDVFKSDNPTKIRQYRHQLDVFFHDVPGPAILDFIKENNISLDELKFAYSFIPRSALPKTFEEWAEHGFEQ